MHYSQIQDQNRRSFKGRLALAAGLFTLGIVAAFLLISHDSHTVATQVALDEQLLRQNLFQQWKTIHNKDYEAAQEQVKFQIWSTNYDFVQNFNQNQNMTFSVGMNQFADLSREEWKAFIGGCYKGPSQQTNVKIINSENAASSVDWRKQGAVTPIKNQGQCGSCWAFSTTGSLEGLNFITNKKLSSFSEQQLVDCSQSAGNQGCNGGLMDYAFKYVSQKGIEAEATYPYTAATGTCHYSASKTLFKNTGFTDVAQQNNAQLAAAVAQQPVSIAIEADAQSFQMYTGGVYNDAGCGTQLDHGVLIVGYGTSGSSPFWIVKNSWGATWGEAGYIRIAKQSTTGPGICGIALSASYPTAGGKDMAMIEVKPWIHPVGPEVAHEEAGEEEEGSEEEGSEEGSEEEAANEEDNEEDNEIFVSPYEDLDANVQVNVYEGIVIPEQEEASEEEEGSEEEGSEEGSEEEGSEEEGSEKEANDELAVSKMFIAERINPIVTEHEEAREEESSEEGSEEEGSEEGSEEEGSEEGSEEEGSEEEGSEEEAGEEEGWFHSAVERKQADFIVNEMLHGHYYGIGPVLPADGLRKYLEGSPHEQEGEEEEEGQEEEGQEEEGQEEEGQE